MTNVTEEILDNVVKNLNLNIINSVNNLQENLIDTSNNLQENLIDTSNNLQTNIDKKKINDLERLTLIELDGNPVWYNNLATMQSYRDLYIPSMLLNKPSVFSFGSAMGTLMRISQLREYNFGLYSINIISPLIGNYYDILLQESNVIKGEEVSGEWELSGSIVQIYPENGTGKATFTCGPSGTIDPIPVAGYPGWTDLDNIYTCGGKIIGKIAAHFCMPGSFKLSCLVAWKTIKEIAEQFDNLLNVAWLVDPNSQHSINVKNTLIPIINKLIDGSMNITSFNGSLHHPAINLTTSNSMDQPTKIWIKAGAQTSTKKEILIARSWINEKGIEEFIEFMTVIIE